MNSPIEYRSLSEDDRARYVALALRHMLPGAVSGKRFSGGSMRLERGQGSGWAATRKTLSAAEQRAMAWMYGRPE